MVRKLFTIHYSLFTAYVLLTAYSLLLTGCATTPDADDIKNAEVHYKIGTSYMTEQRLNDASIEFRKAIKLNPQDKHSLNYLGFISTEFEKYDEAVSYYKRSITIDPNYSEAMNNLGVTYTRRQMWDEAVNYFKMALKNPLYATPEMAYSNMGYAFYKKGDYISSADALKKAIMRNPEFPRANYILGLVYVKLGDDETAIEEFKKAIALAPDYIDVHLELANAYLRTGDNEKAVRHFRV
ncbi:MAG: tetratricopeptide repeat protein, partial [Nitrospirae bacterium]|nr:tetratricopeptide repeat protein [Nitrospirota bacterium]